MVASSMEHCTCEGRRQAAAETNAAVVDHFVSTTYKSMPESSCAGREMAMSEQSVPSKPSAGGRCSKPIAAAVMRPLHCYCKLVGHFKSSWRVLMAPLVLTSFLFWLLLRGRVFDGPTLLSVEIVRGRMMALKVTQLPDVNNHRINAESVQRAGLFFTEDVVTFPDEVLLLVQTRKGAYLPQKKDYECVFGSGGGAARTPIHAIGFKEPQLVYVRCAHPSPRPRHAKHMVTLGLIRGGGGSGGYALLETVAGYPAATAAGTWETLVYEAVVERDSVVLLVKGLPQSRKPRSGDQVAGLRCVFGNMEVMTWVRHVAQEVVRCVMPHPSLHESLMGKKITVRSPKMSGSGVMPSVAYFTAPTFAEPGLVGGAAPGGRPPPKTLDGSDIVLRLRKPHFVCACTMLWNQAGFLKEWVMYHSYLGVERWFLYDNNSDDELEEVVSESLAQYNVSQHAWPWRKTQEAGFSHCALRARPDCEWVMFLDVDEFVYPMRYLAPRNASVLARMIKAETEKAWGARGAAHVGEVRLNCHDFGPSGLARHPEEGVMVGYTCRMSAPQRHKSILRVDALNDSLMNVVHHFELKRTFRAITLHRRVAVINHYKYQVWEVFKAKFYRRVATYMTDWTVKQNENSRDRVPGLGTAPVEPVDWPDRFCQVVDVGLRNFTLQTFQHPHTHQLLWQ